MSYLEFVRDIKILSEDFSPFLTWTGYGYERSFIYHGARASEHVDDCLYYLTEDHDDVERGAAVFLMSRLSLADYLVFIRKLIVFVDEHKISRTELFFAVTHAVWMAPNLLTDNFFDPRVRSLLADIVARPEWNEVDRRFLQWTQEGGSVGYKAHRVLRALGLEAE